MNQSVTQHSLPANKLLTGANIGTGDPFLENIRLNLSTIGATSSAKKESSNTLSGGGASISPNQSSINPAPNVFFTTKSVSSTPFVVSATSSGNSYGGSLSNPLKDSNLLAANFNRKDVHSGLKLNNDVYVSSFTPGIIGNQNYYPNPVARDHASTLEMKQSSLQISVAGDKMEVTGNPDEYFTKKKLNYLENIIKVASDFDNSKNLIDIKRFIKQNFQNISDLLDEIYVLKEEQEIERAKNGLMDKKLLELQTELIKINQTHFQNAGQSHIISSEKLIMLNQELEIVKKKLDTESEERDKLIDQVNKKNFYREYDYLCREVEGVKKQNSSLQDKIKKLQKLAENTPTK